MLISVILPTHNRRTLLVAALEALRRQTLSDYEVIVVADACTDGTAEAVRYLGSAFPGLQVTEVSLKNPARGRNAGARLAQGKYLAFTDDDCLVDPGWLKALVDRLEEPGVVGVAGRTTTIWKDVTPLTHQVERQGDMRIVPTCNAAVSREAFEKIGGFYENFPYPFHEDTDLFWRLEALGKVEYVPEARVIHPPRKDSFSKAVRSLRYFESEFIVAARHPALYRKNRSRSPWLFIYWFILVRTHLQYLKNALGDIVLRRRIDYFFIRVAIVLARSGYLLRLLPRFRVVAKNS
jgi:GT2 family glycosyltransferase